MLQKWSYKYGTLVWYYLYSTAVPPSLIYTPPLRAMFNIGWCTIYTSRRTPLCARCLGLERYQCISPFYFRKPRQAAPKRMQSRLPRLERAWTVRAVGHQSLRSLARNQLVGPKARASRQSPSGSSAGASEPPCDGRRGIPAPLDLIRQMTLCIRCARAQLTSAAGRRPQTAGSQMLVAAPDHGIDAS